MMAILLLLTRLVLCTVFMSSALAKLRDRDGTRQAVIDFGAPRRISRLIAAILPALELLLAIGLLSVAASRLAAAAMAVLLAIFTVVITVSILRGKRTVCHCFGESGNKPVGWPSVARNIGLAALALLIVWPKEAGAGESVALLFDWMPEGSRAAGAISLIALFCCACLAWAFINLFRQHGRLLLRIEELEKGIVAVPAPVAAGLPLGAPIPQFALPSIDGRVISRDDLRQSDKPTLLVFSDPNCGPCSDLLPELERWSVDHQARFTIALVSRGDPELNKTKLSKLRVPVVLVEKDETLSRSLSTLPTPSALIMKPSGRVGSRPALGADGIRQLVEQLSSSRSENGAVVPSFDLPALSGGKLTATDLQGVETLLLFWDPACGFCAAMLDALRRWDSSRSDDEPRLLVVSTGGDEANQAMLLSSPVVLDQSSALARSLGVGGTPSAVLIDQTGHLASEVAVGEPGIWRLLGVGAH